MKPEDEEPTEEPTEEELREAAALADALEGEPNAAGGTPGAPPPDDALEAAALLRHARAPVTVPPAVEPIVAAQAAAALEARRTRGRRRARIWITTALATPVAAVAVWMMVSTRAMQSAPTEWLASAPRPAPTADLLAAQAQATRGGGQASTALARLDVEMRAYRRRYHEGLRRRLEDEP